MHGTRDFRNTLEVAVDPFVTVDVGLEYFPIVDAGLPRRAGVGKYEARLDLFRRDRGRFAVNAVGVEVDGAHPAVESRIVVLAASGDLNDLRLNILGDHTHLL